MSSTLEQLALQGDVNFENTQMSFEEKLIRARNQNIREIFSNYARIENRLDHVATVGGIDFINDVKADNLNASWYSLESMEKPVIWIVNNIDDRQNFGKIIPLMRSKVKAVIVLNKNTHYTPSLFSDHVERIHKVAGIEHAVELAYTIGISGDAVLFSPASNQNFCFDNVEQGGERFSQAVKSL